MNLVDFVFRAPEVFLDNAEFDPVMTGGLAAVAIVFMVIFVLVMLGMWIFMSLIYMKIGKKAGYPSPGLAWIPLLGPALISVKIAQMSWWPILLLIGVIIPFLSPFFSIAFAVFMLIWTWKVFEAFKKPGWWALFNLLQPVGLILIAIVAFGSSKYKGPKLE